MSSTVLAPPPPPAGSILTLALEIEHLASPGASLGARVPEFLLALLETLWPAALGELSGTPAPLAAAAPWVVESDEGCYEPGTGTTLYALPLHALPADLATWGSPETHEALLARLWALLSTPELEAAGVRVEEMALGTLTELLGE